MKQKVVTASDPSLFVNVRQFKRPFGKSCFYCGRSATLLVDIRFSTKRDALKMPDMPYCQEHGEQRGVPGIFA